MIERDGKVMYITKPIGDISNCVEVRSKNWLYAIEIDKNKIAHTLIYGDIRGRGYCAKIEKPYVAFHEIYWGDFREVLRKIKDMRPKEAYKYLQEYLIKIKKGENENNT